MYNSEIENKIIFDHNSLPKTIKHGQECFDYDKFIGLKIEFLYKGIKDFFIIEDVKKEKCTYKITINCNGGFYTTSASNFKSGAFYRGILRYLYKYNIGDVIGNNKILNRKYEEINYLSQKKYTKQYYCECIKCGYKSWKLESNLDKQLQCIVCGKIPKIVVEGINDIPTTTPWMIAYFQGGYNEAKHYTKCSSKKIYPVCPYCGEVKKKKIAISRIYKENGISCVCNDHMSYPNKLMYNILRIKNIEFVPEYSPDWIKPKRYDFYIPSKNIIVEMDGGWHYKNNNLSGKLKEEIQEIDYFKDLKASENGLKVYRVNCKKSNCNYIYESILNSNLNNILQVSENEIKQADLMSYSNLVKDVCEYKNNHDNMTSSTVAKHFNLSKDTICLYIKIGVKYGWCKPFKPFFHYKCILLIKDKTEIGIFKNAERVSIYLKNKYDIDISASIIRQFTLLDSKKF